MPGRLRHLGAFAVCATFVVAALPPGPGEGLRAAWRHHSAAASVSRRAAVPWATWSRAASGGGGGAGGTSSVSCTGGRPRGLPNFMAAATSAAARTAHHRHRPPTANLGGHGARRRRRQQSAGRTSRPPRRAWLSTAARCAQAIGRAVDCAEAARARARAVRGAAVEGAVATVGDSTRRSTAAKAAAVSSPDWRAYASSKMARCARLAPRAVRPRRGCRGGLVQSFLVLRLGALHDSTLLFRSPEYVGS